MITPSQESTVLKRPAPLRRVAISFLPAFLTMLAPWGDLWQSLRPDFMLLLLLYWTVREPALIRGRTAFFLGLLADVADSTTFGLHALGYTVTHFLAGYYRTRIQSFYILHQAFHILLLLLLNQVITSLAGRLLMYPWPALMWWFQSPLTAIFWVLLPSWLERSSDPGTTPSRRA